MSILAAVLLTFVAGGNADGAAEPAKAKPEVGKAQNDPMVCEVSDDIGSRLKHHKICMLRSEWRAQREQNSQVINRAQVQRGLSPNG